MMTFWSFGPIVAQLMGNEYFMATIVSSAATSALASHLYSAIPLVPSSIAKMYANPVEFCASQTFFSVAQPRVGCEWLFIRPRCLVGFSLSQS